MEARSTSTTSRTILPPPEFKSETRERARDEKKDFMNAPAEPHWPTPQHESKLTRPTPTHRTALHHTHHTTLHRALHTAMTPYRHCMHRTAPHATAPHTITLHPTTPHPRLQICSIEMNEYEVQVGGACVFVCQFVYLGACVHARVLVCVRTLAHTPTNPQAPTHTHPPPYSHTHTHTVVVLVVFELQGVVIIVMVGVCM